MAIPKKVSDRIAAGLKQLVQIIQQQRTRDVSEADTVTLVKEVFAEILGYNKFTELTSEFAIKGTFCDLAVRIEDKLCELVEVKAIGLTLNEKHLKQAVDYAANKGVDWVILTNAVIWQLHQVIFAKPIDSRLVVAFDITAIDPRKESDLELVFPFTKEGFLKGTPDEIRKRQDATSRFVISALLLHNDSVRNMIRKELRKVVDVNVTEEEVVKVLQSEVLKRDCLEGPAAEKAVNEVRQAQKLGPKPKTSEEGGASSESPDSEASAEPDVAVSLQKIIAAGVVQTPLRLFRMYKGQMVEATLHGDGTVEFQGQRFPTCSGGCGAGSKHSHSERT